MDEETRNKIHQLRKDGLSERAIADHVGVGKTTVRRTLKEAPPRKPAKPTKPAKKMAPVTDEELVAAQRVAFAEVSELARKAREEGNAPATAAWQRILNGISHELRQHKSSESDPDDFRGIPGAELREAAETGRSKLLEGLERIRAERARWPRCRSCGGVVKP